MRQYEMAFDRKSKDRIVLAYGSNLDQHQMAFRCPSAVLESRASLPGYRLVFAGHSSFWGGGVASLVRDRDAQVEGVLYRMSEGDLERLDLFEGHPRVYVRQIRYVFAEDGSRRSAHVYAIPQGRAEAARPTGKYYGVLWRAYGKFGFDRSTLASAARGVS